MTAPQDEAGFVKYSKRNRKVTIATLQKRCRTIIAREISKLMDVSFQRLLCRDESASLRGYLEILNELEELDKIKALEKLEKDKK